MSWRSVTSEEQETCEKMVEWMRVRWEWAEDSASMYPTSADISKSALFERILSGYKPLPYPPPTAMSCPWYAVVEDKGPHKIGGSLTESPQSWGVAFSCYEKIHSEAIDPPEPPETDYKELTHKEARPGDDINIHQSMYKIIKKVSDTEFIVSYTRHHRAPAYEFRVWYDPNHVHKGGWSAPGHEPPAGAWLMRNVVFEPYV